MIFYKKKLGFTLVEVLVAISILSIAILATFTAVSNSMRATNFTEDQITAYYLADEAIEYIRNKRDSNSIKNIDSAASGGTYPWLSGIAQVAGDPCFPGKVCYVDVPSNTITACSSDASSCPFILYNSSFGLYGYSSGSSTPYKVSVTMDNLNSTEVSIIAQVSWSSQGVVKNYTQTLVLRNWAE
ncbi:MAG: type IV pilus modification PilV family protein [Minisyncoccota bacterium]